MDQGDLAKQILIGTSGWHRLEGFYPPRTRQPDMLPFYAEHFPVVEVATTFQGIPGEDRVREWAEAVPDGFVFDVLAFGGLTLHQRRPGQAAPLPGMPWSEVAVEPPDVIFEEFVAAIAPLSAAGKLGLLMLQFPPWFDWGPDSFRYLERCRARLPGLPLGVEFRHLSWFLPDARLEETLDHLIDLEIALSASDFPPAREAPLLQSQVSLSEVAPVRLHGRKEGEWDRIADTAATLAEYPYSESDLAALASLALKLSGEADRVHVIFNVLPSESAVAGARTLGELLSADPKGEYTAYE